MITLNWLRLLTIVFLCLSIGMWIVMLVRR